MILVAPLPKGTEYLADIAENACATNGLSPYLLLGLCFAESNYGLALKPPGPTGTGDFIPRPCSTERDARMKKAPLPGVVRKTLEGGIPSRKLTGTVVAWVPTHTGWGCGLLQFDYEAFFDFCSSGDWKKPEAIFAKACELLLGNRKLLAAKFPNLTGGDLDKAMLASYNAGVGRVSSALKKGQSLDTVTFHPDYVGKITRKADALAGRPNSWMTR